MTKISATFVGIGIVLILAAVGLSAYNIWDARNARLSVENVMQQIERVQQASLAPAAEPPESAGEPSDDPAPAVTSAAEQPPVSEEEEIPLYRLNPQLAMPAIEIDGKNYVGVLEIPTLSLTLPIIGKWSYASLKLAPCIYSGTAYLKNMVIAGHNYDSHFGGLKNLRYGDSITFTDFDGNVFLYKVRDIETVKGTDIEGMLEGDWALSLFTCTISGQMRITVRCECVSE